MALNLAPPTKLEAVNICLTAMGERPVNSLDAAAVDAQTAIQIIDETSLRVQAMGWHWNREVHTLSPDTNGYLIVPTNTAKIDTIDGDVSTDVVQRGYRLFNVADNTYEFTKDYKLELYVFLPFEDLPMPARWYVTISSARTLQKRLMGSQSLDAFTQEDEMKAWVALMQAEAEVADRNMLTDSWSVSNILTRWGRPVGFR